MKSSWCFEFYTLVSVYKAGISLRLIIKAVIFEQEDLLISFDFLSLFTNEPVEKAYTNFIQKIPN